MKRQNLRTLLLLERLYALDAAMGGKEKQKNAPKPQQEFDNLLLTIREDLTSLSDCQVARDENIKKFGNDPDSIKLGVRVRDGITQNDQQIHQLQKTLLRQLKKPDKYDPKEIEMRVTELKLLKIVLNGIKKREFGVDEQEFKPTSLTELKKNIFAQSEEHQSEEEQQLTKQEEEAMARWGLNDQKMDEKLDVIIDGIDQLNYKVRSIDEVYITYIRKQIKHQHKQISLPKKLIKLINH